MQVTDPREGVKDCGNYEPMVEAGNYIQVKCSLFSRFIVNKICTVNDKHFRRFTVVPYFPVSICMYHSKLILCTFESIIPPLQTIDCSKAGPGSWFTIKLRNADYETTIMNISEIEVEVIN